MFPPPEKIVVVTRKTVLEELVERHNSREQARFYVEARGATFANFESEHDSYQRALETLRLSLGSALPPGVRVQWIERDFLPQFVFGERDLVVALGPGWTGREHRQISRNAGVGRVQSRSGAK